MNRTHCILYIPINRDNPAETTGRCLDYHDADGNCLKCADAIDKGYCCKPDHKKSKTPVIK